MFIRTLPTTLHQIFSGIVLNSQVIAKSIKDPDDNGLRAMRFAQWLAILCRAQCASQQLAALFCQTPRSQQDNRI